MRRSWLRLRLVLALFFQPSLQRPLSRYVGTKITVNGGFWPGGSNQERAQSYVLTIAEVDEKHRFPRDSTNRLAFKVVLEMPDDRNGTAPLEQEEDVHYWWVARETVESHILEAVRTKAAEVAAAASAAATAAAAVAAAAAPPTTSQRLAAGYTLLYDVKAGTREHTKGGEKVDHKGHWHKCRAPGCAHEPFFVSVKGNKSNCWEHSERAHPAFMAGLGVLRPGYVGLTGGGEGGGEVAKLRFDDPEMFGHNLRLVKYLQSTGQSLSAGENTELRDFVEGLNPAAQPACYIKLVEIQHAQRMTQKEERAAAFAEHRKRNELLGGQFDMWTRHGRHFASFNYTYLVTEKVEVLVGTKIEKVDRYAVRSSVLDFVEFTEKGSAENIRKWLDQTVAANTLTWDDFNLLVPDGASNCVATLELLHDKVDSEVCFCHALARGVLTAIGEGAAVDGEHKAAISKVGAVMKKMRTLATKFHRNGKLSSALHASQAADGVAKKLETIKAAITRWNAAFTGTLRNLQLKAHIEHALALNETISVYTEDAEGHEVVVETRVDAIRLTDEEWTIGAEAAAVLEGPYITTQVTQGLQTPPEDAYMSMVQLHAQLAAAPTTTYKIPTPPLPGSGSTALIYQPRHYDRLNPGVKAMIAVLKDQVYNRVLSSGPTKTALLAMKSNPFMSWPPSFLTVAQVASADMHYEAALFAAQAALDGVGQQPSPVQTMAQVAAGPPPAVAPAGGAALAGFYDDDSASDEEAEDTTSPLFVEGVNWAQMKKMKKKSALYMKGMINRVTRTPTGYNAHGVKMDTRAFWADRSVQAAFPAGHYVYCGVATAINHEANSEGTFSFAGRAFNKFRTTIKSEQLCDTVVAAAGEKRKATAPKDVQKTYKRLRAEGVAVASAAAVVAAAAAVVAAAAAVPAAP